MPTAARAAALLRKHFGPGPLRAFRACGRVNLIGEHVDYLGGSVLPVGIDRDLVVAFRPRSDRRVRGVSEAYPGAVELDLDAIPPASELGWAAYPVGVLSIADEHGGQLPGMDFAVAADLPPGAGLSSSAALLIATSHAVSACIGENADSAVHTERAHRAETEFVGVPCGIMDPYAVQHARCGSALYLDCRRPHFRHVSLPESHLVFVVFDSGTRHELRDGGYAQRVAETTAALETLRERRPELRCLAEVDEALLLESWSKLTPPQRRRTRHVVGEVRRTAEVVELLATGDCFAFGERLNSSHRSLRDHYEVSTERLDHLFALASRAEGVYGARLVGAGFGGTLLAAIHPEHEDTAAAEIAAGFAARYSEQPGRWVLRTANGPSECTAECDP